MSSAPIRIQESVKFGDGFEFDLRSHSLRRAGRVLKLERIPLEILFCLIEQKGELASREQIVERVWGKGVFLDTDNSINGAIRKIRQALKDDPEQPRYIQTITGKGYRFIAPVLGAGEEPLTQAIGPNGVAPPLRPEKSFPVGSVRWRWIALAAGIVLVVSIVLTGWLWRRYTHKSQPAGRAMLAVLPFENLTGDPSQEYVSDGLTEELITQLGQVDPRSLGVIARTSVMRYKKDSDLGQIVRELGVNYVLEGSVRRDGEKIRIDAQLIQTKDQTHVWARQYDRDLTSLFSLQSDIAHEVADEIDLTLGKSPGRQTRERKSPGSPASYEAYDLYLKGRYFWNKRAPYFQQAAEYFQQAIDKDPNYARAYAGLADTYALMSTWDQVPANEFMPKARAAALKALQIDENLAEAHTSLALIAERYDYDWQTAEKEYRRAIQLDPAYATAHQWYAECLSLQGRFDEAFAESERARELDPLSLIIATDHGVILYFSRQYDRAIEQFHSVIEMDPTFYRAYMVVNAEVEAGRFDDALAEIERWHGGGLSDQGQLAIQVFIHGRSGNQAEAQALLAKLRRSAHPPRAWEWLPAYLGVGQNDAAIALLQKAYAEHGNIVDLKVQPNYDPLRNDPRFQDLLRRVGLGQ
jgi:TolB-like protein/DNA-binding winged helix-turn-helix (wHTH) protein/Tfp pilus assembly protein PilF